MEFVKKVLIRIGRHYNLTYGKWIMGEGTWSEFVPQEPTREKASTTQDNSSQIRPVIYIQAWSVFEG